MKKFLWTLPILAVFLLVVLIPGNQRATSAQTPSCVTTGEAQALIGQNVVRLGTEACAWTWRSVPQVVNLKCPSSWICTIHEQDDRVVVQRGIGQTISGKAGTFRLPSGYQGGLELCIQYNRERDFGRSENPPFEVFLRLLHGDSPCPGAKLAEPAVAVGQWLDSPRGNPTCPRAGQWLLLYWSGPDTSMDKAAIACQTAVALWAFRNGRWIGFSPLAVAASDSFIVLGGEALMIRGGGDP